MITPEVSEVIQYHLERIEKYLATIPNEETRQDAQVAIRLALQSVAVAGYQSAGKQANGFIENLYQSERMRTLQAIREWREYMTDAAAQLDAIHAALTGEKPGEWWEE